MVTIKIRNATMKTDIYTDTEIELQNTSDIMIDPENVKELLSDCLFININIVRAFCNHFTNHNPILRTPEEHAKIEMAFKLTSQLIKTDVLDNLITKENDNATSKESKN